MTHNFECLCGAIPAYTSLFETVTSKADERPAGRVSLRWPASSDALIIDDCAAAFAVAI